MNDWVKKQIVALKSMQGKTVLRWVGSEMALRDHGVGGLPTWDDESIPYLQLWRLDALLAGRETARIATYQNDTSWGLSRRDDLSDLELGPANETSIFRTREVDELPLGEITEVSVETDICEDIAAVKFVVAGHRLALRAGEVYEEVDGSLRIAWMDESILVDVDGRKPNKA